MQNIISMTVSNSFAATLYRNSGVVSRMFHPIDESQQFDYNTVPVLFQVVYSLTSKTIIRNI